jgi:hypothetical protein
MFLCFVPQSSTSGDSEKLHVMLCQVVHREIKGNRMKSKSYHLSFELRVHTIIDCAIMSSFISIRLILFLKLFLVMGISWIFEVISWAGSDPDSTKDWYLWIPFDLLNFIQAVSTFFIFAAKRENLLLISRKYPKTRSTLCIGRIITTTKHIILFWCIPLHQAI